MYNRIIEFIRVNCWTIIKISVKVLSDTRFDIFTNSFWAEISTKIINDIPMIFAPGIPEVFHKVFFYFLLYIYKYVFFNNIIININHRYNNNVLFY